MREPLDALRQGGPSVLPRLAEPIAAYVRAAQSVVPDRMDHQEALAFWINLYNAGALLLAADARRDGSDSVLCVPGGFRRRFVTIAGEDLSLDAIEHAKVRRFRDPRVHAALVCGSVSCPTLRHQPYDGRNLAAQLDDQMRSTLTGGAMVVDGEDERVALSRIFLWFGADFVHPERMPSFMPVRRSRILGALGAWMEPETRRRIEATNPQVDFQSYDWGLACEVG